MSKRTPAFYDYTYKEIEPASRVSDIKIHDKNGDSKTVGVHQRKVRKIKAGSPTDQSKITPTALKCKKKKERNSETASVIRRMQVNPTFGEVCQWCSGFSCVTHLIRVVGAFLALFCGRIKGSRTAGAKLSCQHFISIAEDGGSQFIH